MWGGLFSTFDCTLVALRRKVSSLPAQAGMPCDAAPLLQHSLLGQGLTCASVLQEDPWNSIAAGALTGGFLQLRMGAKSAARSAAFGGVLLVSLQRGVAAKSRPA